MAARNKDNNIRIRGAREHNLQSVDVDIPLGKITVVTGPSGSGKTSLAMHTLYAEGQRRYMETFSPYVRQFMDRMERPDVSAVENVPPAIALEQRNFVKNSRSTVGTMTGLNEYLKLIFARMAVGRDAAGRVIRPETPQSVAARLAAEEGAQGREVLVCFAVTPTGSVDDMRRALTGQGYLRLWSRGEIVRLDDLRDAPATGEEELDAEGKWLVVQDRVRVGPDSRQRLAEAVETAMRLGGDVVHVYTNAGDGWSDRRAFRGDWYPLVEPRPELFSSNSPLGACPECKGYGRSITLDYLKGLDPEKSIRGGALKIFESRVLSACRQDLVRLAKKRGAARTDVPWKLLTDEEKRWVVDGEESEDLERAFRENLWYGIRGVFRDMERHAHKMSVRVFLSHYRIYAVCPACHGGRLRPEALSFTVGDLTVPEVMALPMEELLPWIDRFVVPEASHDRALMQAVRELRSRVAYLGEVGLGYIAANRLTRSLSGGEIERVSLTTCLGAALTETLFVLDEPTVGLHPRDTGRLMAAMERLKKRGNTLVVVEHEESVMRAADYLVDMGPASGSGGGKLVYAGKPEGIEREPESTTGRYLSKKSVIAVPPTRRKGNGKLEVRGAECHNLHDFDVDVPLGVYICLTGVSGSGKSTLAREIIYAHAAERFGNPQEDVVGRVRSLRGLDHLDEAVLVDQSPIVRTPRSTPAVYIGVFEEIRRLFAQEPAAKIRGLTPGYFSFNSGEGRCPRCSGLGQEKVEMQFLSDIFVPCALCGGSRYTSDALSFAWEGRNMAQMLAMDIKSAHDLFAAAGGTRARRVAERLDVLLRVGLGHLGLGQPLNTLSGGENQRLKLARILVDTVSEQGESRKGKLLILDEPGTGLHFADLDVLLGVFRRLTERGHTLLVIEHNMELVKCADYVIDLGPEGGTGGGTLVATGTPEEVACCGRGHTAAYLKAALGLGEEPRRPEGLEKEDDIPAHVIALRGARHHQLKNIDVDIPRNEMTVVTGLSGSGKSTLAFDIIFAEGQKRFLDVMSPYARQFTEQMETPDIDRLTGLPPTVAIEQNRSRGGTKSTVGTVTEIWQFLRLLYAKLGTPYCPTCGIPVGKRSQEELLQIVQRRVARMKKNERLLLAAPVVRNRKGHYADLARWAEGKRYPFLRADGELVEPSKFEPLDRYANHDVDVVTYVIERKKGVLVVNGEPAENDGMPVAVARTLELGEGFLRLLDGDREELLGTKLACPECATSYPEPEPSTFSFNSPRGWCLACRGHGRVSAASFKEEQANSLLEAELRYDRDVERAAGREEETRVCPVCRGTRLTPFALGVRLQGRGIAELGAMNAHGLRREVAGWRFEGREADIARNVVAEIDQRLDFLVRVGLGYLSMDRSATTLSGGETQRIRLAAQLGSALRGVLYVLDEPTIGLHPADNERLLDTLAELKKRGNTLLVVEHDEETMRRADHLIDLGPGAGIHGGEVVASGAFDDLERQGSVTGLALKNKPRHPYSGAWRGVDDAEWIELKGCSLHNLKKVNLRIPAGRLTVLTGPSGAGKTSLMTGTLAPAMRVTLKQFVPKDVRSSWVAAEGLDRFRALYQVDQAPIGKTPRSTPATYIGVFDEIRRLFAESSDAKRLGFDAGRFSFNTSSGHCEACKGTGLEKREMDFLPPCSIPCETCRGRRYNSRTLQVRYKGKTIADVLDMSMEEAAAFFASQPRLSDPLKLLCETGLGYLTLGQASNTISGGEAQRIKLVAELIKGRRAAMQAVKRGRSMPCDLYLIEEPTIGLHPQDVRRLIDVLQRLVDLGNTVVVVEHNLELIAEADYIVDIGPGAGEEGGRIVAEGSVEQVTRSRKSATAPFLRQELQG